MTDALELIRKTRGVIDSARAGSRVICRPAPTNTDDDYVVLVRCVSACEIADTWNCHATFDDYPQGDFVSFRKGAVNAILTQSAGFYERFCLATTVARHFNLREKRDRITLFRAILYNEEPRAIVSSVADRRFDVAPLWRGW